MGDRPGQEAHLRALEALGDYMNQHELKLASAESCTAGLIGAMCADVSGSGQWFEAGFVTYSPNAKNNMLDVSPETIERYSLTSEPVAREMAQGALAHSAANVTVANTGLADEPPEDSPVPAGTQCFAWAFCIDDITEVFSETQRFSGERNEIRRQAAEYALQRIPYYHRRLQGAKD